MAYPFLSQANGIDILPFLPDPVICTDASGRIEVFNRAAEECFGYSAAEIIGQSINILIPPKFRAQHAENVADFSNGSGSAEQTMGDQRIVWGLRKNGEQFPAEARVSRKIINGRVVLTVVHRDVTERAERERRREVVASEQDHRFKNVISVVGALVALAAKSALNVNEFKASLQRRLGGLAATQGFLTGESRGRITLEQLLKEELTHFAAAELANIAFSGPSVVLHVAAVQPLAMAIHELATNSAKYGALAQPGGLLAITTAIVHDGSRAMLTIAWEESGGPLVREPTRSGFGTMLVDQMIRRALHGEITTTFDPAGLACRIRVPMAEVCEFGGDASPA